MQRSLVHSRCGSDGAIRVGFKAADGLLPDEPFFTHHCPESYVVPTEADGGEPVLDEVLNFEFSGVGKN